MNLNGEQPKKRNKQKITTVVLSLISLLVILTGTIAFIDTTGNNEDKDITITPVGEVKESYPQEGDSQVAGTQEGQPVVIETTDGKEPITTQPDASATDTVPTTEPDIKEKAQTNLDRFFLENENDINGLAVGFSMMETILSDPSNIKDVMQIKDEMLFTEGQYRDIFDRLRKTPYAEGKEMLALYESLLSYRMTQADSLQQVNGIAVIELTSTELTEITNLWKDIVTLHKTYSQRTGVDFTGGLGDLMR